MKKGLTQNELASRLNVSRDAILNLENKDKQLYDVNLIKNIISIIDEERKIKINDDYLNFILNNPGQKIRLYREKYNLNKTEFAQLMGVSLKTVRCWEKSVSIISKNNCVKLNTISKGK
ncbi:MAG: helix-turn-helix domain-containing protein [Bacilli bacterium]|nr:helix-turn-helix domain-containing protein [Bacilli bacterium]